MHVSNKLLVVFGLLATTFWGCSDKSLNQEAATVDVAFKIVADAKSDFAAVASTAEVKISAEGMPTLTQSLTVTSGGINGTITRIVAGPNRKFEVYVYDAANKLCYYGSSVGEVTVGGTANIAMTLYRTNGEGNAVINGTIQSTNTPPTVSLTSPTNNAQFTLGTVIPLAATASDADGSVSSVAFYNGTTLLFTDNSSPYSYNFTPSSAGAHSLKAVATDNAGSSTTSSIVTVTVVPGSVTLVYEAENAALTPSAAKNTNHTGYSGTGFVDGFYNSTSAKVVFTVNVPSAGTYTLTTRYGAGNGTSSNTGLYINNTKIKNISCTGTANWDTWANQNETVTLNSGNNTIGYKAETSSGSCINIDKITITGSAPTIYSITYTLNGGTNNASNPATYTSASATITLAAPSRTGYAFGGWYDNAGFTGTVVTSLPAGSTGNKTYYAKWVQQVYIVSYVANNSTSGTVPSSQTKTYDVPLTLASNSGNLARTGYNFAGWNTSADGSGTDYAAGASYTANANVTLYAKWSQRCVITFLGNSLNVQGSMSQQIVPVGVNVNLNANGFSLSCYTFSGWATSSGGSVVYPNQGQITITSNITLYAKWVVAPLSVTPAAGVTIDYPCSGTVPSSITVVTNNICVASYEWHTLWMGTDLTITDNMGYTGAGTATLSGGGIGSDASFYCIVTDLAGNKVTSGQWVFHFCQPQLIVTPALGVTIDYPCSGTIPSSITVVTNNASVASYEWHTLWMGIDLNITDNMGYTGAGTATLSGGGIGGADASFYCIVTDLAGNKVTSGQWAFHFCQLAVTPATGVTIDYPCSGTIPSSITVVTSNAGVASYEWHTLWMGADLTITDNMGYTGAGTATLSGGGIGTDASFYCIVTDIGGNKVTSGQWRFHFCQ